MDDVGLELKSQLSRRAREEMGVSTHFGRVASLTLDILDQGEMYTGRRQRYGEGGRRQAMSQSASNQVAGHHVTGPDILVI